MVYGWWGEAWSALQLLLPSPVTTPPPAPPVSPVHLRARWSEESGAGLVGAGRCARITLQPVLGAFFARITLQPVFGGFLQPNLCNWLHLAAKHGWGVKVGVDTIKVGRVQLWQKMRVGGAHWWWNIRSVLGIKRKEKVYLGEANQGLRCELWALERVDTWEWVGRLFWEEQTAACNEVFQNCAAVNCADLHVLQRKYD